MKILITSTSFQSTQGEHYDILKRIPHLELDSLNGPLPLVETIKYADKYDGIICGDDEYNEEFFKKASGKLQILSKYGVGLDKIDLKAAQQYNIPVKSCPGINSSTVAEHVFAMLLNHCKNITPSVNSTRKGEWLRPVGIDLLDKNLGLLGLGNIAKEVAKRASAFGMTVSSHDPYASDEVFKELNVKRCNSAEEVFTTSHFISLHVPLNTETTRIINTQNFSKATLAPIVINTSRGGLIDEDELLRLLETKKIGAYLTDVLDIEPMSADCKIYKHPAVTITGHIGSRTTDNIKRQALMSSQNLLKGLNIE